MNTSKLLLTVTLSGLITACGGGGGGGEEGDDMGRAYRSRKEELEDRIRMKKMAKAEKMKKKLKNHSTSKQK